MIIKIIPSKKNQTSQDFGGVRYNNDKIEKGTGELMKMRNFPSFIDKHSSTEMVKNYFKAVSAQNGNIKKPQFHCTISAKERENSKEDLALIAEKVMDKMGYGKQPFIIVFHNDTANNHVHIVSTRVDKDTGEKIDHNFENLKSQTALREVLKELYGIDHDKKVDKLLKYKFSNENQLKLLMKKNGYDVWKKDEKMVIANNGISVKEVDLKDLNYTEEVDLKRKKQIFAILNKYKDQYSNKVFGVVSKDTVSYKSELQKAMKDKFGLDIVFSQKDDRTPFGYTIVDNKSGAVFKGSDIIKMKNLFEFTQDTVQKEFFDILEKYNIADNEMKEVVLNHLNKGYACDIKEYMAFNLNKKVPYNYYDMVRNEAINYIRGGQVNENFLFIEEKDRVFIIDEKENKIFDLERLVGVGYFNKYKSKDFNSVAPDGLFTAKQETEISPKSGSLMDLTKLIDTSGGSSAESDEDINKKRENTKRKTRRR